jgi:hypothetical protein
MRLRSSPHSPDLFDCKRHRAGMLAANQQPAAKHFQKESGDPNVA